MQGSMVVGNPQFVRRDYLKDSENNCGMGNR